MKQVVPGVYNFTGLMIGRVYMVEDRDGLTLIDTGMGFAPDRIIKQLREAGHRPSEVKRILITHAHTDHVGGLPQLKRTTGAQVIAPAIERPVIEGKKYVPRKLRRKLSFIERLLRSPRMKLKPAPVGREVADGDTIEEVMGGLKVVATPGHTPGQVAYWQPDKRVLFCGDTMAHVLGLRLPSSMWSVDMDQAKRSIKRVARLDPLVVCFGHGEPLVEDAARSLRDFAGRL